MFFDWYWVFLFLIIVFHVRTSAYSIYLHRGLAHRLIIFKPVLHHFFRFILWATNFSWANYIQFYCAQHRKHHRFVDTPDDPHSPYYFSIWQLLDFAHNDPNKKHYYMSDDEVKYYSPDVSTPTDWIEKNIYEKYVNSGVILLLLISFILYGFIGLLITFIVFKFKFLTYFSAGAGNYLPHKWGYKAPNAKSSNDKSTNVFPIGLLWGGEELHNNHHTNPVTAKFSIKWWEMDIGWFYIKILKYFRLLELKYDN